MSRQFRQFRITRSCTFLQRTARPLANEWRELDGLNRARELIHDTHTELITLDALAEVSGLLRARFLRAFRRQLGMPPHAYQIHSRLDHARRLIASGTTISDAAVSAGFFDQRHFHRHFLKMINRRNRLSESITLDFRAEFFNAFNNVQFAGPNTAITSSSFGHIFLNQVNTPRQIQASLRLRF